MVVPFGFSVGDFLTIGKILYDIIQAVNEHKGAAADYRSFLSTLRSLYSCTNAIKDVLGQSLRDAPTPKLDEQALINGIIYEIRCCRELLDNFLDATYKYTAELLPPGEASKFKAQRAFSLSDGLKKGSKECKTTWRKISWAVFRKEDVQKLERDLQGHFLALQMYQVVLQSMTQSRIERHTDDIAVATRRAEVTTTAIFDLLKSVYNMLPPRIGDKMHHRQPIIFEDAIGRVMELPQEFCLSLEVSSARPLDWATLIVTKGFHRHLEILFEGMPGYDKVINKEYRLNDIARMSSISSRDWHLKVTAGARVAMTIKMRLASKKPKLTVKICARCDTVYSGSNLHKMMECYRCKLLFEIIETRDIAKLADADQNIDRGDNALDQQLLRQQGDEKDSKQDAFRRIRYFCATQNNQCYGRHVNCWLFNDFDLQ